VKTGCVRFNGRAFFFGLTGLTVVFGVLLGAPAKGLAGRRLAVLAVGTCPAAVLGTGRWRGLAGLSLTGGGWLMG